MAMGGLLIDTLAYNFLNSTNEYDTRSYSFYDWMSRDFFKYLSELPDQNEYAAPGSRQCVKVKKKFQKKAQKAYKLAKDAIESSGTKSENNKWKKLYGRPFPAAEKLSTEELGANQKKSWTNTEEFIEDKFSVDIRYQRYESTVRSCKRGFRKFQLREMLGRKIPLKADKKLRFWVKEFPFIEGSSQVYWKVLNRGDVAKKRDCIRGQIVPDDERRMKEEKSDFLGEHIVECYLVQNNVVVAKDRIHVPIIADASDYE